ncbi:MAG TPA: AlkA N-terminal domain-containing protein [Solimonas sp.]|nr:AlkA N-terminal domain-containing protein [Solimonas sp.]
MSASDTLPLRQALHHPQLWATQLAYLSTRLIPGQEHLEGRTYVRQRPDGALRVDLAPDGQALQLRVSGGRVHADDHRRLARLFALDEDWTAAEAALAPCPILGPRLARQPGLRPLGCWDPFELCLRTVLGQQVTVAAANTLMARLHERAGAFTPEAILAADLSAMGMPGKRVDTLRGLARAVAEGRLDLEAPWSVLDEGLQQLPGFGPWTRSYLAIRLGREPDAFPASDVGLIRAAGVDSPKALLTRAEAWRPWRSLAAIYLWVLA